jgi:hypothetical protein
MVDAVYSNKINLQQSDTVRLIFSDERPPSSAFDPGGVRLMAEVVLSPISARALRDLLVEHIKDEPVPGSMN